MSQDPTPDPETPAPTVLTGKMRRSYAPGMFSDLTQVPHVRTWDRASGVTTLTFPDGLDEDKAAEVWARVESSDDTDQARRAAVRDSLAGPVEGADLTEILAWLIQAVDTVAAYSLGDPLPEPPEPDPEPDPEEEP